MEKSHFVHKFINMPTFTVYDPVIYNKLLDLGIKPIVNYYGHIARHMDNYQKVYEVTDEFIDALNKVKGNPNVRFMKGPFDWSKEVKA